MPFGHMFIHVERCCTVNRCNFPCINDWKLFTFAIVESHMRASDSQDCNQLDILFWC